jgi:hypothetical protein
VNHRTTAENCVTMTAPTHPPDHRYQVKDYDQWLSFVQEYMKENPIEDTDPSTEIKHLLLDIDNCLICERGPFNLEDPEDRFCIHAPGGTYDRFVRPGEFDIWLTG